VKNFFLRAFFSHDELNIVDQQHVHCMKPLAEAEHLVESQGVDHFNRKFFRAHVAQPRRRIALLDGMPDGMHQVRLTHSHPTVKKQRIVRFSMAAPRPLAKPHAQIRSTCRPTNESNGVARVQ